MKLVINAARLMAHSMREGDLVWPEVVLQFFRSANEEDIDMMCMVWYEIWFEQNMAWQENAWRSP